MRKPGFLFLLVIATGVTAQKLPKATKDLMNNIENQLVVIYEYKKETNGNPADYTKKVTDYIVTEWDKSGLKPFHGTSFLVPFEINEGKKIDNLTSFLVNGEALSLMEDYYPLIYSANAKEESYPNLAIKESGVPWFVNIQSIAAPFNADEPAIALKNIHNAITTLVKKIQNNGATCLIIYENAANQNIDLLDGWDTREPAGIPIIYIKHKAWAKYFTDQEGSYEINYNVKIVAKNRVENNLMGMIDNKAPKTLVFSANYDIQDRSNSMMVLLALANQLQLKQLKNFNYVFIGMAAAANDLKLLENTLLEKLPNKEKDISCRIHIGSFNNFDNSTFYVMKGGSDSDWPKYFTVNKKDILNIEFKAFDPAYIADFNGSYPMLYCSDGVNMISSGKNESNVVSAAPGKEEVTGITLIISKLVDIVAKGQALSKLN